MTSVNPIIINTVYTFYIALQDMANPGSFKANPTIAAGDFKYSIDDGALVNFETTPSVSPSASIWVKCVTTGSGMNGDNIKFQAIDVTNPKEWADWSGAVQTQAQQNFRKNVALSKFQFLMTDSTNHAPVTGKTVTVTRSIDGGAFAAGTLANVTEVANGTYTVDFGAGDLNGNVIVIRATAAGSDDTFATIITIP